MHAYIHNMLVHTLLIHNSIYCPATKNSPEYVSQQAISPNMMVYSTVLKHIIPRPAYYHNTKQLNFVLTRKI